MGNKTFNLKKAIINLIMFGRGMILICQYFRNKLTCSGIFKRSVYKPDNRYPFLTVFS